MNARATSTKPEYTATASEVRIVKSATCPSLSGKTSLSYEVGCTPNGEVCVRVSGNDGTGFFSQEWVALSAIQKALAKAAREKEITSFDLRPLFEGKSVNTAGFLLAALKSEGLITRSTVKRRCYEYADDRTFVSDMQALATAGKVTKAKGKPIAELKPAKLPKVSSKTQTKAP